MSGAVQPASSIRCLISGTAAAASFTLTVTRTISDPASASSMHWRAVPAASAVSVIVIDCTATGAPPPTWTVPTRTPMVVCSFTLIMSSRPGSVVVTGRSYHPSTAQPPVPTMVYGGATLAVSGSEFTEGARKDDPDEYCE